MNDSVSSDGELNVVSTLRVLKVPHVSWFDWQSVIDGECTESVKVAAEQLLEEGEEGMLFAGKGGRVFLAIQKVRRFSDES